MLYGDIVRHIRLSSACHPISLFTGKHAIYPSSWNIECTGLSEDGIMILIQPENTGEDRYQNWRSGEIKPITMSHYTKREPKDGTIEG
jgi:hypothetical protein